MNFTQYLEERNYTVKTIESYNRFLKSFLDWIQDEQLDFKELKYNDIIAYTKHAFSKGHSKHFVQQQLGVIRHYLNFLIKTKKIKDNVALNINIKGVKRGLPHDLLTEEELDAIYKNYPVRGIVTKRSKIIVGLMVYQGLNTEDLSRLEEGHLKLKEGKMYIPAKRRSNSRTLDLRGHQIIDLQEYVNRGRMLILELSDKQTNKLFTSYSTSERFSNMQASILKNIAKYMPQVQRIEQIRSSVIAIWTQKYDLRTAQYMAGHRYVSTTENYQKTSMDDLKKDVHTFHPLDKK